MKTNKRGRSENLGWGKPRESGNRGDRHKRDVAAEIGRAVFRRNEEAIYRAMLKALKQGNPDVFKELAERAFGKVPQRLEISSIERLDSSMAQARKRRRERTPDWEKLAEKIEQARKGHKSEIRENLNEKIEQARKRVKNATPY